jgi:sn-glycerol 3-phosphate transport system substrate-binding protein
VEPLISSPVLRRGGRTEAGHHPSRAAATTGCNVYGNSRRTAAAAIALLLALALGESSGPAGAQGQVEITFWYGVGGQLVKVIEGQVDKYNRSHPGIHVTPFYAGYYGGGGPMQQKLLASIAAGSVPDVVQLEIHGTCTFASKGALLPLDDLMAKSTSARKENLLPGLLTNTSCGGKTYGMPFNRSVPILYYNRDMFVKAGIKNPPRTWTELAADAAGLTTTSPAGKVYGFEPINEWWFYQAMTWSAEGEILTPDLKHAAFATEEGAAGLRIWLQLIAHGYAQVHTGPSEFLETIQDFVNAKTAMYWGSAADMGADAAAKFDWRAAVSPGFDNHRLVVPQGGANAVIMAKVPPDHQRAAWQFIEWWTSPDQTVFWSEQTGYVPVMKAALDDPGFKAFLKANPNHAVPLDELKYSRSAPPSPKYFEVLQLIQQAQQNIISGGMPVTDTLKTAAQQVDATLAAP